MDEKRIFTWLNAFAPDKDSAFLERYVLSEGNFLWHALDDCLEGDEARTAFNQLTYEKAIWFEDGYGGEIRNVSVVGKCTAETLDKRNGEDIYITAEDFSWTYVKTHENGWFGPYFCLRKDESKNCKEDI